AFVPCHPRATGPVREVREVELESAVRQQAQQPLDLRNEIRRAIRGKTHDLELVAIPHESEVLRDREVEQAERVREIRALQDVQPRAAAAGPRGADEVAESADSA